MVCDHCSSEVTSSASHVTGYQDCPNYCTVCKDVGQRRYSKACPNRACTRCNTVGISFLSLNSKIEDCRMHMRFGHRIQVLFSSRSWSLTTSTFSTTRRDVSASPISRLPFLRLRRLRQSLLRGAASATFNFQVDIESACWISGFKFGMQPYPPPKIVLPEFLCEVITVHCTAQW